MNPHEAMQELERVVEIDDLENVRLVGMPGLPPERYSSSGSFAYLARPEAKSLPRDHAYWETYHFAVDCYRKWYFGAPKKGRPRQPYKRGVKAAELHEGDLSWDEIAKELGLSYTGPWSGVGQFSAAPWGRFFGAWRATRSALDLAIAILRLSARTASYLPLKQTSTRLG